MANIEYIQKMLNQFLGNGKNEFFLEQKERDTNKAAICGLVSGCVPSSIDVYFEQGTESAMPSFGQTHEGSSLAATV